MCSEFIKTFAFSRSLQFYFSKGIGSTADGFHNDDEYDDETLY